MENRRTGQSTKLADKYIQQLFTTGEVVVRDHYGTDEANMYLFDRVLNRLVREHKLREPESNGFRVDKSRKRIIYNNPISDYLIKEIEENFNGTKRTINFSYRDIIYSNIEVNLSLWDRIKVLIFGKLLVSNDVYTVNADIEVAQSISRVSIRPLFIKKQQGGMELRPEDNGKTGNRKTNL